MLNLFCKCESIIFYTTTSTVYVHTTLYTSIPVENIRKGFKNSKSSGLDLCLNVHC